MDAEEQREVLVGTLGKESTGGGGLPDYAAEEGKQESPVVRSLGHE